MNDAQRQDCDDSPIGAYLEALVPPEGAARDARYQRGRALIELMACIPETDLWQVKLTPEQYRDVVHFDNMSGSNDPSDIRFVLGLRLVLRILDECMPVETR